jgi:hypothetical protein
MSARIRANRTEKLARLDSNQDQLIQSQSCCRYTTGQWLTWAFSR